MKETRETAKMLSLITQLGISVMVPIFLCVLLGSFLDDKFGTSTFVPLLILGILAGIRNCYIILKKVTIDDEEEQS